MESLKLEIQTREYSVSSFLYVTSSGYKAIRYVQQPVK